MARGVMRQTNSELNKLRMKNVIHYDDEVRNAITVSKEDEGEEEEEEKYSDERSKAPYYQSFVSLYDFGHHPPKWSHSWALLDGNKIRFYSSRGENVKALKGVATILPSTHLSRLDSQDRDFCLRLNHIEYDLQSKKGSTLENTVTMGLFDEKNASFWQKALQCAVDSCRCDTPAMEPETPTVSATFSPDVIPVPPPLPPRNSEMTNSTKNSEVKVPQRRGHRKKNSKIQELLGKPFHYLYIFINSSPTSPTTTTIKKNLGTADSVNTLKTRSQEEINRSLEQKAKSLPLYPIDPEPRLSSSLNHETLRSYVSCAGRHWNHLSQTSPIYSNPYGDFVRTSSNTIQITLLLRGEQWPTKNGGSFGDAPVHSTFFGLKKVDEEAESKKQECRVTIHTNDKNDWKQVACTNRVRFVESAKKNKDEISIESGAPIFPVALLIEISEKSIDETTLQFRIHSVDDEETFVMSRMDISVIDLLHRVSKSKRDHNEINLRSSLWPGLLRVIVVPPDMTLRLELLPLLRPMRQSYQFKQHVIVDAEGDEEEEEKEEDKTISRTETMIVTEEVSETTLSFLIPSLYLQLRGEEMLTALTARRERNHLKKTNSKDKAETESLDAITEMLDLMERKVRDDYVEASGVYWRRFLCNDAFRSSKQKKDHTVKAIPVNLHVQSLVVDSFRTQASPHLRSSHNNIDNEQNSTKLVSQLSTEDLKIRGAVITKAASSASLSVKHHDHHNQNEIKKRHRDRYTFLTWGSPASHTDKFKNGGMLTLSLYIYIYRCSVVIRTHIHTHTHTHTHRNMEQTTKNTQTRSSDS